MKCFQQLHNSRCVPGYKAFSVLQTRSDRWVVTVTESKSLFLALSMQLLKKNSFRLLFKFSSFMRLVGPFPGYKAFSVLQTRSDRWVVTVTESKSLFLALSMQLLKKNSFRLLFKFSSFMRLVGPFPGYKAFSVLQTRSDRWVVTVTESKSLFLALSMQLLKKNGFRLLFKFSSFMRLVGPFSLLYLFIRARLFKGCITLSTG